MRSSEIALFLNRDLIGEDIEINSFSSLSSIVDKTVVFAKKNKKEYSDILEQSPNVLAIVCQGYEDLKSPHIISPNPRLDFLRVVGKFFEDADIPSGIHRTAVIEDGAEIGKNVTIGAHCHIGSKVRIGDNTTILPNCTIIGKVIIGHGCYIKPNSVIGGAGFGFEYDENDVPVHFPHTGEVIIGNNVHIGSSTTIDRATIDATIIEDNVKIDNQVQIAHNCTIRKNVMITGGVLISGGVEIGENSWLGPNVTIYQQLKVGKHCKLGMGAVVLRNVKDGKTVFGNPAEYVEY